MDGLTIRRARPGDGEACARLWVEFGVALVERMPDQFRVPTADGLAAWFEDQIEKQHDELLRALAEQDGAVVGLAQAVMRRPSDPPYPTLVIDHERVTVTLEDIVVAAGSRGSGIGEALVRHVEDWGRARGATALRLHSDADGPARRFYERLGYDIKGAMYGKRL